MKFYVRESGRSDFQGPMSPQEIRSALAAGHLSPECEVVEARGQSSFQLSGSTDWQPVTELGLTAAPLPAAQEPVPCAECGSERVVPKAVVWDQGQHSRGTLQAYVHAKPEALFFKEAAYATLYARICADCGHASLFAEGAEALYEAYQRSQSGRTRAEPGTAENPAPDGSD